MNRWLATGRRENIGDSQRGSKRRDCHLESKMARNNVVTLVTISNNYDRLYLGRIISSSYMYATTQRAADPIPILTYVGKH